MSNATAQHHPEPPLPGDYFDYHAVFLYDCAEPFERLSPGESVSVRELLEKDDVPETREGTCLATAMDEFCWFKDNARKGLHHESWVHDESRQYVERVTQHLRFADYHDGRLYRRLEPPLGELLRSVQASYEEDAPTVPMKLLEHYLCRRSSPYKNSMQYPGTFKALYDTGSYTGVMTCSWCHLGCGGADFLWIKDDLCLFWLRSDTGPNAEWIKLFPFRVDRTGDPGRLLRNFRRHSMLSRLFSRSAVREVWE